MKLAFVAPVYPYRGGIAHFAARLSSEASMSHEILHINFTRLYPDFLFPGKTQFDTSERRFELVNERLLDSVNPLTWGDTGKRIRDWGADAVIFHWWHPFFAPAYKGVMKKVGKHCQKLFICHNVTPHDGSSMMQRFSRNALR
ncbi:glycosyl transferase, partial [Calditrichota bacterium]